MNDLELQQRPVTLDPVPAAEFRGPLPAGVDENDAIVPLDAFVPKLAAWRECQDQIKFWEKRLERLQAEMDEAMGAATVGTVNGEAVLFHRPQERFATGDFKKAYPEMAKLYSREITKQQFDEKWLRASHPDMWSQFQVRSWRMIWEQ